MESLGYRILPLSDPELIADAVDDMSRAGKQALHSLGTANAAAVRGTGLAAHVRSVSTGARCGGNRGGSNVGGKAVIGLGRQITPAETPVSENVVIHKTPAVAVATTTGDVGGLMITAFAPSLTRDCLRFSPRVKRKRSIYNDAA
jgi:hypothetical protein